MRGKKTARLPREAETLADVGVDADLVGVGVMGVVFRDPPAETHPDQYVRDRQTEEAVCCPRAEDLLMAGVVADERKLGEHHSEERGDTECRPRVADDHERCPSNCESHYGPADLQAVVTDTTVEQTGVANLNGERSKISRRGVDGG